MKYERTFKEISPDQAAVARMYIIPMLTGIVTEAGIQIVPQWDWGKTPEAPEGFIHPLLRSVVITADLVDGGIETVTHVVDRRIEKAMAEPMKMIDVLGGNPTREEIIKYLDSQ